MNIGPYNLIITGGTYPNAGIANDLARFAKTIIACDGGIQTAHDLNISPNIILGDFDTISIDHARELFPNAILKSYPSDKDFTDTELGIKTSEKSLNNYILIGGGGGRMDHFLALFSIMYRDNPPRYWVGSDFEVFLIDKNIELFIPKHQIFSIFPLGLTYSSCKSSGFQWDFDGRKWKQGEVSLSNRAKENAQKICEIRGKFALVHAFEKEQDYWGYSILNE